VRSLASLLQRFRSADLSRHSIDPAVLWSDAHVFWQEVEARPGEVRRAMRERYPLVAGAYVDRYFEHILNEHRLNPLALLYIESELGAPARQQTLLAELEAAGMRFDGARCLDVGCSNGSLLLAAREKGAARCVGVDVSEARLASARELCQGSDVELRLLDLATGDLPENSGPFDVIFCTDVLEHVESIPGILAAMARYLAPGPDSRIFVTLFNRLSTACVLSEPHYDVPGMVLLDRASAAEIWLSVRSQRTSNLDYEVERWPDYASLQAEALRAGLTAWPHLDTARVLGDRGRFWTGYATRLEDLRRSAGERLDRLQMSSAHRTLLRDAIAGYCRDALDSHRAFEAALPAASDADVIAFYMKYYAQPMRLFLTHL
jgi:2-polyprenyl-3-methyl-5-hydroxy-6-metoxy-1,4-benzoquinol methylase